MKSKLDRFRDDIERLAEAGEELALTFGYVCFPDTFEQRLRELGNQDKSADSDARTAAAISGFKKAGTNFVVDYHAWYSEAHAVVSQLLPNRLEDFVSLYKKPKNRKTITADNYTLQDAMDGLQTSLGNQVVTSKSSAVPKLKQQVAILKATERRLESSLFDLEVLVQADILGSELEVARELLKHKFFRAVGAVCGVVLEKHLATVCRSHALAISKRNPTLSDFNDALKSAAIIDTPTWRRIQHLADLRNLSVHNAGREPTPAEAEDLVDGALSITKSVL